MLGISNQYSLNTLDSKRAAYFYSVSCQHSQWRVYKRALTINKSYMADQYPLKSIHNVEV